MDIHEFFAFLGVCLLLHFNSIKKKKNKKKCACQKKEDAGFSKFHETTETNMF
jgi:hypothetical protein